MEEITWEKECIKIDEEEYSLYRKKKKQDNKTNYIHIEYGDAWYKIEENFNTIFLGNELYTSKFYKKHIENKYL